MDYVFNHSLQKSPERRVKRSNAPQNTAQRGDLDLDAELAALQSGNPLQQLRSLRDLYEAGLLMEDVMRQRQNAILDAVMRATGQEAPQGSVLQGGPAFQQQPGDGSTKLSTPHPGELKTHAASPVTSFHKPAGAPSQRAQEIVDMRQSPPQQSALADAQIVDQWVDQLANTSPGATSSPHRTSSDVSPKPTQVPLEQHLTALEHAHDTAHIVARAIEARSRNSLW